MRKKILKNTGLVLLAGLLFTTTGCGNAQTSVDEQKSRDGESRPMLLTVNWYGGDELQSQTKYEYNDRGQIVKETNSFYKSEGDESVEVYELHYDSEGRLIKKERSSGESGYSSDDLEREYDKAGHMISEASFKIGDYWYDIDYTYDAENRVDKEIWKVDYNGNGTDFNTEEYQHSYSVREGGTLEDKVQLLLDGEVADEHTNLYDSSSRLIQGYDDYWAIPIYYEYTKDKYFNVYTESETIEESEGEYSTTYAEILDASGKMVDKINLSIGSADLIQTFTPEDKPKLEYNSDGYLIKAQNSNGYVELIYEGEQKDEGTSSDSSENGKSTGNVKDNKADPVKWDDFISNNDFLDYIETDDEYPNYCYAIYDLDGDKKPELLLEAYTDNMYQFGYTWIFKNTNNNIQMIMVDDEEYGNHGYRQYQFLPKKMEIVGNCGVRPNKNAGWVPFYKLENGMLEFLYEVGYDMEKPFFLENGGDIKYISEKEYESYLEGIIEFDWKELRAISSIEDSHNTDDTVSDTGVNIFSEIQNYFIFSSGSTWITEIKLENNGSFKGTYYSPSAVDDDMICKFSGSFGDVSKINDNCYSMKLKSIKSDEAAGIKYKDKNSETLITVDHQYGFDNGDKFLLYLPGTNISKIESQDDIDWIRASYGEEGTLKNCLIVNCNDEGCFIGSDAPSLDEIVFVNNSKSENGNNTTISEEQAKQIAINTSKSVPEYKELEMTVDEDDVEIVDKNSDAYIIFVGVGDEYGFGHLDVIWVNAKTGEAKLIEGTQEDYQPGKYDVSTGNILQE